MKQLPWDNNDPAPILDLGDERMVGSPTQPQQEQVLHLDLNAAISELTRQQEQAKKIDFQGMIINVENSAGSVREGKDKMGKKWRTELRYPYGEIEDSEGVDGDPVDVFVGPNRSATFAYVIHQLDPYTGEHDEDKVMLGFDSMPEAKAAYCKHYDQPEKFFGSVDTIKMDRFKKSVMKTDGTSMIYAAAHRHHNRNPWH